MGDVLMNRGASVRPEFAVREVNRSGLLRTEAEFKGFDDKAGTNYVYPRSTDKYPFREYQYKICMEAFFQNTLVVLPDGLGKSFIASVVMYNIYRWYPMSKVIFLSASKSVLKGQMEACSNIMNIPRGDCVEITGKTPSARLDMWKRHRVIFGTPRQMLSDFRELPDIPFVRIKLLVVTEAHKARGNNNPYTHIIELLGERNEYFRILAQTSVMAKKATEVVDVVKNLRISNLEIRHESSPDIAAYVSKSSVRPLEAEAREQFRAIRDEFLSAIDPFLRAVLVNVNVSGSLSKAKLTTAKKKYIETSLTQKPSNYTEILSNIDVCIELYHAVELLNDYGVVSFLAHLDSESVQRGTRIGGESLRKLMQELKNTFARCLRASEMDNFKLNEELYDNIIAGHPKIAVVEKVLMEHFQKNMESRLIIFSNCPKTTPLIHQCLRQKCPQLRSVSFQPHEMSESERNCTRLKFIRGTINTIITASIPDEGVVNEVDLIICYDTNGRHLKQFIRSRVSSCGGKKCQILVAVHEGADTLAHSELWRERGDVTGEIDRNPIVMEALACATPRLVPVEFNPVNLTPSLGGKGEKTKGAARNIVDYFKNVPLKSSHQPQECGDSDENDISVVLASPASDVIPVLTSMPLDMILQRVEKLKSEQFSNVQDGNLDNIIRGSHLVPHAKEFFRELLERHRKARSEAPAGFFELLEKDVATSQHRVDYFASILENVMKKLNGCASWEMAGISEEQEEIIFDVSDLNTGFIDAHSTPEDDDLTRKSICGETILSFYLISSLSELFESNGRCDESDMRTCKDGMLNEIAQDISHDDVSDGEEVIPCSQENVPLGRNRRAQGCPVARKADVGHGTEVESNPGLQLCSTSSSDSDNKFNLGSIEDIFNGNGCIFERDLLGVSTPPPQNDEYTEEFTSPSLLSGRSVNSRLKHSNNNTDDLPSKTNSVCTTLSRGISEQGSSEVFATCQEAEEGDISNTQHHEFSTCRALNSQDVAETQESRSSRRQPQPAFIHFEAAGSGDDEEDEDDTCLLDSIVVSSDEDEQLEQLDIENDMQAKYLQSVRSPTRNGFRIPHPDKYRNITDVFSQTQPPEVSEYIYDSFVVEEADESDSDLSVLSQAEAILRARKRLKRSRGRGKKAKKSRILAIDDSSEDDDLNELRRQAGMSPEKR
ncbi:Fanconi anemia group M protein homolog [Phlebotomus argentipes]|uniref:Fanconi anemia group M protein homolog n=1 Tax=Phlebotomus argentipes TaxID=94469 RepID=UPI0028932FD6|nr:Fanconi anemia group M protein homolog [Phlebotomus argentipes]